MKAAAKLEAALGGRIAESMGATRPSGAGGPTLAIPTGSSRLNGIKQLKGGMMLPLDRVAPDPDQPRKEFDPEGLDRLAASLKTQGQVQPIRVRWNESVNRWIIIAGERRWRAARIAGLEAIAAVEAQGTLDPDAILEEQLVENCLRDDLKPIEQARAFEALLRRRGWSMRQLGEHLHLNHSAISRALSLLDLPEELREAIDAGSVAPSTGQEIAKVKDPEQRQALADQALAGQLVHREARARTTRPRKMSPTRARYAYEGVTVQVTFDRPDVPHDEVVAALRRALDDASGSRPASDAA
jgi:ParB family transcriptional regulator, chromosome partitioning protein